MNSLAFTLYAISITYFMTMNLFYLGLQILAFFGSVRRLREVKYTNFNVLSTSFLTPPLSVIIPAYNEEVGITDCVYSTIKSDYPEFEVIVVNDGSADETLAVLIDEFQLEVRDIFYRQALPTAGVRAIYQSATWPHLWVIDKDNGGKADSLNAGVNLSRYRYVVTSDADSIFDPTGLLRIIRLVNLDPSRAVGVGGQIRVGNGLKIEKGQVVGMRLPKGLLPRLQVVEYLGSFLGNRTGWSELNSVMVISGAFGLWEKNTMIELGGMTGETTHEDIEYTFRLHEHFRRRRLPYWVYFVPDPIVWTEVPTTLKGLFAQRRRWQRVVNEVVWRYRRMFLNPRYGIVGMIGMPYMLVYEILGPLIEIASYLLIIFLAFKGLLSVPALLLFLLVSFGLTIVIRAGAMFVEQYSFRTFPMSAIFRLLSMAVLENLGYHQFLSIARILAFWDWIRGEKGWARVKREGL